MKVKSPNLKNISNLTTNKSSSSKLNTLAKNKAGNNAGSLNKSSSSTTVNLSERAQRMSKANEIASKPSFNSEKVARLQSMIDKGTYKVDSAAVADRLVDNHLIFGE